MGIVVNIALLRLTSGSKARRPHLSPQNNQLKYTPEKVAFRLNGVVGDESDIQSKTLLWSIDRKYKLVLKKMNGYRLFNAIRNYLAPGTFAK